MDFMKERETSPEDLITRRYPLIAILKLCDTCPQICVYCQRNWELMNPQYLQLEVTRQESLAKAIDFFKTHTEFREVLITGGDPLMRSNKLLEKVLRLLSELPHIRRIRIGTRFFVTLPQRIDKDLVEIISRYHIPGRRELSMVTHIEHPYEITPQTQAAVQLFLTKGIKVYNQQVFTLYNSRYFETAGLLVYLKLAGVEPYYIFNAKGKEETVSYRVPIARLMQALDEIRLLPGMERPARAVFNVPGIGKVNLADTKNRRIIGIYPDGSRAYLFMHWGNNLFSGRTYLYKDVPIYDYFKRLSRIGEDPEQYGTIWYSSSSLALSRNPKLTPLVSIDILPLVKKDEKIDDSMLKKLKQFLLEALPLEAKAVYILKHLKLGPYSSRKVEDIFAAAKGYVQENEKKINLILVFTEELIYEGINEGNSTLAGGAAVSKGVSVVSTAKMGRDDSLPLQEKINAAGLHEIGHLLDLRHCNGRCVMYPIAYILGYVKFCPNCQEKLKKKGFSVSSAIDRQESGLQTDVKLKILFDNNHFASSAVSQELRAGLIFSLTREFMRRRENILMKWEIVAIYRTQPNRTFIADWNWQDEIGRASCRERV